MAVSSDLEALKLKIFLVRRQPLGRLVRFGPPNIRNVPMPLTTFFVSLSRRVVDRKPLITYDRDQGPVVSLNGG